MTPAEIRSWPHKFQDQWIRRVIQLEDEGEDWQEARRLATEAIRAEVREFLARPYPDGPLTRRPPNGPVWA